MCCTIVKYMTMTQDSNHVKFTNVKPAPEITNIPDQLFWFKNFKEVHDGNFKINILYGTFFG
jgi:hypothetical protein